MDINDARILITVVSFVVFISIVIWAWSSSRKKEFAEAANLPFADSDLPPQADAAVSQQRQPSSRGRP